LLGGRLYPIVRRLHPGVRLKIMEGGSSQLDEWLADEVVDIAIRYRYGASLLEHEQALAVVDSYLVGPPGDSITAQPQVRFDALRDLPLVLPSERNGLRNGLDAFARQQRTTVVPVIESDSMPLQKLLIVQEHLYTVLPIHAVWEEVRDGTLQAAHICDPPFQRTLAMSFARTKGPARAVTAIAQHICEIFDELAASGMWERDSE
jgi:DNA-binding transcriptional LysR family regulator